MVKKWTESLVNEYKEKIIQLIEIEGYSVVKVCSIKDYPAQSTFYEWVENDENFAKRYARACERRADKIAEDIMTICDATADDIIIDIEGNQITNHNVIQRDKLRVDTRKWLLSKLVPKKYGDKLDVTTDGNPIDSNINVMIHKPKKT